MLRVIDMKKFFRNEISLIMILLMISVVITGYELRFIRTGLLINKICNEAVDYDAFRTLQIGNNVYKKAKTRTEHFLKAYPRLSESIYMDPIGYLTYSMLACDYDLVNYSVVDEQTFRRGILRAALTPAFQELYGYYNAIFRDIRYFPVPVMEGADVTYEDSWQAPRYYGGDRLHEGSDLMASNDQRGYFPVLSITDGIVEKMGWLEQGGYRIGIRSEAGAYFYYAHLDTYAPELETGDRIIAGQLIGFMGDSGYGTEGTVGQFDVHLHLGIYINGNNGEMSVNPYHVLQILERTRIKYK